MILHQADLEASAREVVRVLGAIEEAVRKTMYGIDNRQAEFQARVHNAVLLYCAERSRK